ncbi:MAG: glucose-6-phosphate isomerase [Actinobacteria bacterium]|uniref:Unannotated protein n=1 Tax=freshwater metagenome TaxID=449393 RepID=A0A6J6DRG2_9ZZZZ|nr:glucose-6-phosphate isomerase [Actinomycetota bacterium]MTA89378.1 glucose-6-phosphate isomerase [Actinomycetota bacterium]
MNVTCSESLSRSLSPVVEKIIVAKIASRLGEKDQTIWGPAAESEASIRLGWITSARDSLDVLPEIFSLRDQYSKDGVNRFVLCGMGGSSLAPEVISRVAGKDLFILDSTSPEQVSAALIDLERTAVIVSSKSGSTVETDSQKRIFEHAFQESGIDQRERIVIVTDPGSPLDLESRSNGYKVFNADPNVGGRYSALTAFGLVPAGLAGCDIGSLANASSSSSAKLFNDSTDNPAIWLAAAIAGQAGKDKFLIEADRLPSFGDWVEQLVAESTGKQQKGVLPVAVTSSAPELSMNLIDTLTIRFDNKESDVSFGGSLGEVFILWEVATAIAGWLLEINPFDQPNVESAKIAARALLERKDFSDSFDYVDRSIQVKSRGFHFQGTTVDSAIEALLSQIREDGYLSIQAYLSSNSLPQFQQLRDISARRIQRPVTFGWGPRFLHSTGQYHKGGPKQGVFLQLTLDETNELAVPGRPFTFSQLISAQASGDAEVLKDQGLPVLSLKLENPLEGLELLKKAIES